MLPSVNHTTAAMCQAQQTNHYYYRIDLDLLRRVIRVSHGGLLKYQLIPLA